MITTDNIIPLSHSGRKGCTLYARAPRMGFASRAAGWIIEFERFAYLLYPFSMVSRSSEIDESFRSCSWEEP